MTLFLRWRDLLDHDPGHGVPPGISIRPGFLPYTVPHIYSHSDHSCGNSLAVSSNISCSVNVGVRFALVLINMGNTINGEWTFTFYTVEGEIPALTAIQAVSYPVVTVVLHFQGCIVGKLGKNTVLEAKSYSVSCARMPSTAIINVR